LLPALNARFGLVDSNLKRILTFGKFPPIERKGNNSPTKNAVVVDGNLFQGRMEIANKKLYFAHSFVDLISVYNIEDGSNVLNILGPEKNLPPSYVLTDNGIGVPSKDSKNAYGSIRVTTRFIYALYSGLQSNDREGYLCSNIYKFDLAGNPIARFELDKDLTDFIIDEENNLIYAVQPFGDTPLVTFDYSDFEQ
jgi:hypothetical protein